jgi:hypothetical protein
MVLTTTEAAAATGTTVGFGKTRWTYGLAKILSPLLTSCGVVNNSSSGNGSRNALIDLWAIVFVVLRRVIMALWPVVAASIVVHTGVILRPVVSVNATPVNAASIVVHRRRVVRPNTRLVLRPVVSVIATMVNAASIVVHRRHIVRPNTRLID